MDVLVVRVLGRPGGEGGDGDHAGEGHRADHAHVAHRLLFADELQRALDDLDADLLIAGKLQAVERGDRAQERNAATRRPVSGATAIRVSSAPRLVAA